MARNSIKTFSHLFFILLSCSSLIRSEALSQESEPYDPNRFERTIVSSGLVQPMEMTLAPDGTIYFIELGGNVKAFDPKTMQTKFVGKLEVTTIQENGLIGVALDPDFRTNQWIYFQYSPPSFSGQHISRFTLRDGLIDPTSEVLIMKYEEQRQECCHHAGSMEFGLDGCLYIGTGDNTNPFGDSEGFAPIDEREARSAFNALRTSANTKNYNGKVLRIRPLPQGGYAIPEGNLFPQDGSMGHPEIYVMGCRNPWRISIDRKTGYLYWGDVGPDAGGDGKRGPRGYDEVNQARGPGFFGWPLFIANNQPYRDYDFVSKESSDPFDPNKPINRSAFNSGTRELPPAKPAWIYYPGGKSNEFPELGSGGRTACAGPSYDFDPNLKSAIKFPQHFDRCLFIYEWSRNWIVAVHMDTESNIRSIEPFLPQMKFTRPIDMLFDQQGSLYVLEYGETWGVNADARLIRLDYRRGNRIPSVRIQSDKLAGKEPLEIRLTSDGTTDKDGDRLNYRWEIRRAEATDASTSQNTGNSSIAGTFASDSAVFTATQPGIYNATLFVDDQKGGTNQSTLSFIVGNAIPEVRFLKPRSGDFIEDGDPIAYQVLIQDKEDGSSEEIDGFDFIDADAPKRVFVQASLETGEGKEDLESAPSGLKRMRNSDCFNCHANDRPLVGPPFIEIANKYRDQTGALEKSIERVKNGSSGVWGKVPMLPHAQFSDLEIREMVEWVYSVRSNQMTEMRTGISNEFALLQTNKKIDGPIRLTVNYTDRGMGSVPPLTSSSSIVVRPRTTQAENSKRIQGMQILNSQNAENGKFCGGINNGSFFILDSVSLNHFSSITASVTSAGAGGRIEVRVGGIDGPLVSSMEVEVNGSWDKWYQVTGTKDPKVTKEESQPVDLYVVCRNESNRNGLMNIDWIRFNK